GTIAPACHPRGAGTVTTEVIVVATAATVDLRQDALRIAQSAGMAPSHHNTQPWSLAVGHGSVEVWAEPARRAEVADPDGRQLMIGVGAALCAVRLELAELGLLTGVALLPDPDRPDPAALVRVTGARPVDAEQHRLWREIPHRRTVRDPMRADVDPD